MNIADRILDNQDRDGMLRRSLERIIQLYTDRSHFVYELLQNAEDAKATRIKFIQYEDRLVVMHNGAAFTVQNLQGLCDIGQSDKINDLNQIGEFGVGFKSVFSICDRVRLYSNPRKEEINENCEQFAVEIQDFTRPVAIEYEPIPEEYSTVFVFPYKVGLTFSGFNSMDALKKAIAERLKNLGITTLLFMHNLSIIDYEILCTGHAKNGQYMLKKENLNAFCSRIYAVETENKKRDNNISFLKFSTIFDASNPNRTLDIAFQMTEDDNGKITFQPAKNPYISVYFPTETESKLKFIVQGPFRTTPNRSSVPFDDDTNMAFAQALSKFLRIIITTIKSWGWLDLSFIKILPLDEDDFWSYNLFEPFYEDVKNAFLEQALLPTKDGKIYASVEEAMISRNKELPDLITNEDMTKLINDQGKHYWLPTTLTETGTYRDVFTYLTTKLGVEVIRPEDLRPYFNNNTKFLKNKDNSWIAKLYQIYEQIPNVFGETNPRNILDACIVKTQSGKIIAPYRKTAEGYLPNVFLAKKDLQVPGMEFVDYDLFNRSQSFFTKVLHLTYPNEYELFKKELRTTYKDISNIDLMQHLKDTKNIIQYLKIPEYSSDLKEFIKKYYYLRCKKAEGITWVHPFVQNILFPVSDSGIEIEKYYHALPGFRENLYIDYDFYQSSGLTHEDLITFNIQINIVTGMTTTFGEYNTGSSGRKPEWHTSGDFRWKLSIHQIEDALTYITQYPKDKNSIIKSQIIFKILQTYQHRLIGDVYINGQTPNLYDEPSEIIRILRKEKSSYKLLNWNGKWLYTDSLELVSQKEISKRDLNESLYGKVSLDSNLYELLGFKKNKSDKLEDVIKEYDKFPEEKRNMFFEIELQKRGLSIDQINNLERGRASAGENTSTTYQTSAIEDDYEFPTGNIKNWDALKKHAAQILSYANPVKYEKLVRSIRVSRPTDDIRAYLLNMYRINASYRYACQICHNPTSNVVTSQIEFKPDTELEPMNLCLCPKCAKNFQLFRNNSLQAKELLNKIMAFDENEITQSDHVSITIQGLDIWFTQTHFAEITELLKLKTSADKAIDIKEGKTRLFGASMPIKIKDAGNQRQPDQPTYLKYQYNPAKDDSADTEDTEDTEVSDSTEKAETSQKITAEEKINYRKYLGHTVYHKAVKAYGQVFDCDDENITIRFRQSTGSYRDATYRLAMCIEHDWLQFDVKPPAPAQPENTEKEAESIQIMLTGPITGRYKIVPYSGSLHKLTDKKTKPMFISARKNGQEKKIPVNISEAEHTLYMVETFYKPLKNKLLEIKTLKLQYR